MSRRFLAGLAAIVVVFLVVAVAGAGMVLLAGSPTPSEALAPPRFVDETAASGLDHTYGGDYKASLGGGMAVLDCDDDGRPDLFVAGGDHPAALFRNESQPGGPLRFARVDGVPGGLPNVTGAYPLDVDGDGKADLAVLEVGGTQLLRGLGGCQFEPANDTWSFTAPTGWTTAFSAMWEDGAALPTLALGTYVGLDANGDANYTCPDNALYRPADAGSGYSPPIPLSPGYCPLSMLFSDWDGSGRRDLRVSNDRHYYDNDEGQEQLWRVAAGEPPRLYTVDDGWVMLQMWGMGIGAHDVTGDGYPDFYLTSQGPNFLQTLLAGPAQPTYRDIASKSGVVATRPVNGGDPLPSTAWHPEFQDVNNDGFVDLFVSKGNISNVVEFAARDPSNLFLGQPDGVFVEVADAAGIVNFDRGRGAAVVDLDLDGLLDLVEVKLDAPVRVWRNVGAGSAAKAGPMGSWLGVRLRQPGSNRDAIGALIEVQVGDAVLRREVVVGGGHISGQLGPVHVGLGRAREVRLRVTWPDGEQGPWLPAAADQVVVAERGADGVSPAATPGG